MKKSEELIFQFTLPIEFSGRFPPNASALSGVGFDSVSISKSAITLCKSLPGAHPLPSARLEITLKRNSASLYSSFPPGSDSRLQEMRATGTFLRVLSLFPSIKASASELSRLALPALDAASTVAGAPYEAHSKRCGDAHRDLSSLLAKNRALLRSSEENVLAALEQERQISLHLSRISELEAVSDDTLQELLCDWLDAHRGNFNAALFSKAHKVPPARAEEGILRLLANGSVRKIAGRMRVAEPHSHGEFEKKPPSPLQAAAHALGLGKAKPSHSFKNIS